MAKFVIVEDDVSQIEKYRSFLHSKGIVDDSIWPPRVNSAVVNNAQWIAVKAMLLDLQGRGFDPRREPVVLILDLALRNDGSPDDGVHEIRGSEEFLSDYIILIVTRSAEIARRQLARYSDHVLSKRDIDPIGDAREVRYSPNRFWSSVRSACLSWEHRTKRSSGVFRVDRCRVSGETIALKLFESRFGVDAFYELAQYIGDKRQSLEVPAIRVLNGGFSGAAVLLLEYKTNNGTRRSVVKLADDEKTLQDEADQTRHAIAAGDKFAYSFNGVEGPFQIPIAGGALYYLEMVFVGGLPLEDVLLDSDSRNVEQAIKLLKRWSVSAVACGFEDGGFRDSCDVYSISGLQLERCKVSLVELEGVFMAQREVDRNDLEFIDWTPRVIGIVSDLLNGWVDLLRTRFPRGVFCYEQHGDFHARNIIQFSGQAKSELRLIDAARFGVWPAYYDLTRLRLNLAVRLLDPSRTYDEFLFERMDMWEAAWVGGVGSTFVSDLGVFGSRYMQLNRVVESLLKPHFPLNRDEVRMHVLFNEAFDLIKMISYVDLSIFKRVWLAWRLVSVAKEINGG